VCVSDHQPMHSYDSSGFRRISSPLTFAMTA
jgi:hypothetical protein